MRRFLFNLVVIFTAIAVGVLVRLALFGPMLKKAAKPKQVERNPALIDPVLGASLSSPVRTPEVKGAFDQKSRSSPTASPSR